MSRPERPAFRGVTTYRDPSGRFSFRYPSDWHLFDLDEEHEGVMVSPYGTEPATYFGVWISPIDAEVVAADLDVLASGVDAGLRTLSECSIAESAGTALNNMVKLERRYSYRDGDSTRHCASRYVYAYRWQFVMTWQGATEDDYTYWRPMANYAFAMFDLPDALWLVTDRDELSA